MDIPRDRPIQLRIESDGTPWGTKVLDEDGNLVNGVQSINIESEVGNLAKVTITFLDMPYLYTAKFQATGVEPTKVIE